MIKISIADSNCKQKLYELWKLAFEENDLFTSLFFENAYQSENCIVAEENNILVSALHMLPSQIVIGSNRTEKAQYIYGAATLKEFRGQGIMKMLLEYADEYGRKHGEKYSILMPANDNLFEFYKKCGYTKFYKIKEIILKRDELNKFCATKYSIRYNFTIDNIDKLRFNNIIDNCGSVLWNKNHLKYAVKLVQAENGFVICTEDSYVFVTQEKSTAIIKEIICNDCSFGVLLSEIMKNTTANTFIFRLKEDSPIFKNMGTIKYNGMIKSLCGESISDCQYPYLGLTLD